MRNQPKHREIKTNPDLWEINQRIEKPKLINTHEESTQRTEKSKPSPIIYQPKEHREIKTQNTNHNPNLQKSNSTNKSTNPRFMRRKERTLNRHHHHSISHHHHIHHKVSKKLKKNKKNTNPDAQDQSFRWQIIKGEGFGRERDYLNWRTASHWWWWLNNGGGKKWLWLGI